MKQPLHLEVRSDHRGLLRDAETIMHLIAEVTAADQGLERERPPLSVVFVLDVSTSMTGEPLRQVIAATQRLIRMLRPDDRAGVVAFSTHASVIADVQAADAETKKQLERAVGAMRVQASTNIEAGLRLAQQILPARRLHERQVLLLLSDGLPNDGTTTPEALSALAASMRPDVATSTLGFGAQHSEPLLSAICDGGGGTYHYIRDPALSYVQFAHALGAQADIVAEKIELTVKPADGVQVLAVLGRDKLRFGAGGVSVDLPDLVASTSYKLGVRLSVQATARSERSEWRREARAWPEPGPAGRAPKELGPAPIAEVVLAYRPAGAADPVLARASVELPVTRQPSELSIGGLLDVLLLRAEEERKRARDLADRRDFAGAARVLREAVAMIEKAPGFRSDDGSALAEAWDQLRDDADLYEQVPDEAAYAEFRRGQRMSAGGDFFAGSKLALHHGTRALVEDAAGPLPKAALVELESGKRFELARAINVIGRSPTCDIHVPSSKVSRQSAVVVAVSGRFWVEDLGSTNAVFKDGVRIQKHQLQPGDVISIGDVSFRYETE